MSDSEHSYTPPQTGASKTVPDIVRRYLDGQDLLGKTQALRLSTVDSDGWPHASLLSAGDVVAVSPERLRFAVFRESTTTANLVRDGRVTLTMSMERGMCELRLRARPLSKTSSDVPLALFEAQVEQVRMHVAPYADVVSGITFELHKPNEVRERWERQIAALRSASS
jgi:Pyridoxamine 5'-phosphate oxidase